MIEGFHFVSATPKHHTADHVDTSHDWDSRVFIEVVIVGIDHTVIIFVVIIVDAHLGLSKSD